MSVGLSLSEELRAIVIAQCGRAPLACTFEPGGKLHGVGIASPLYCVTCGHARTWHVIADAAALAEKIERSERLPFFLEDMRRSTRDVADC